MESFSLVPLSAAPIPRALAQSFGLPVFDSVLQPTLPAPAAVGPQLAAQCLAAPTSSPSGRHGGSSEGRKRHKPRPSEPEQKPQQKGEAARQPEQHVGDEDCALELSSGQPTTSEQNVRSGPPVPCHQQEGAPNPGSMQTSNQRGTTTTHTTKLHASFMSDQLASYGGCGASQQQLSMSYPGSGGLPPLPPHPLLGGYPPMHPTSYSGSFSGQGFNPFGPQASAPGFGMYGGYPPVMPPYLTPEYAAILRQMQQQQTGSASAPHHAPHSMDGGMCREDCGERDDSAGGARAIKRPRLVWTPQLHKRFEEAIVKLGETKAVPKNIMQEMNVEGLTRENVASHLQKYRLQRQARDGPSDDGTRTRMSE